MSPSSRTPFHVVRPSPIQGLGVFAAKRIRKGTRVIEYTGERISPEEAERRYDPHKETTGHVVLFMVSKKVVIDGAVDSNDAKYINHSCSPNCIAYIERGRVFIEALRTIQEGEELTYDYQLVRDGEHDPIYDARYACLCGLPECRGTMIGKRKRAQATTSKSAGTKRPSSKHAKKRPAR
jgi:uncharacterized protein